MSPNLLKSKSSAEELLKHKSLYYNRQQSGKAKESGPQSLYLEDENNMILPKTDQEAVGPKYHTAETKQAINEASYEEEKQ